MSATVRGRQSAPLGLDGESFYLRKWLQPAAAWVAHGITSGQFAPDACRCRLEGMAADLAARAGFQRRAADIVDSTDMIRQEVQTIESRIDRLVVAIEAEIRPMITKRTKSNFVLARAHDMNGQAGFLIRESDVNDIVRETIREMDNRPQLDWRRRRHG